MERNEFGIHYIFAHQALPHIALTQSATVYELLSSTRRDEFLVFLWDKLQKENNLEGSSEGLHVELETVIADCPVYIIRLPEPNKSPEALFVGISFLMSKNAEEQQTQPARYFTLELGPKLKLGSEPPAWIFCEWRQARKGEEHLNRGPLIDCQLETFRKAVEKAILSGR